MAPEVMLRFNHNTAVDYFAVGVMAYECMNGRRPYVGKSRKEIREHIMSKQVEIKMNEIPPGWSVEAADFINRLIQRKPENRLGNNGSAEVKSHPWLRNFNWEALYEKRLKAPFIPPSEDNFDESNINEKWKDLDDPDFKEHAASLRKNEVQAQFNGYYYDHQLAELAEQQAVNKPEAGAAPTLDPDDPQSLMDNPHALLNHFNLQISLRQ